MRLEVHHVRAMLGHANISQPQRRTDGLHESMQRFDAARCKPVEKEGGSEHRPVSNEDHAPSDKGLLH
jgi:hypothetical protein